MYWFEWIVDAHFLTLPADCERWLGPEIKRIGPEGVYSFFTMIPAMVMKLIFLLGGMDSIYPVVLGWVIILVGNLIIILGFHHNGDQGRKFKNYNSLLVTFFLILNVGLALTPLGSVFMSVEATSPSHEFALYGWVDFAFGFIWTAVWFVLLDTFLKEAGQTVRWGLEN